MPMDRSEMHVAKGISISGDVPPTVVRLMLFTLLIFTPLARGAVQGWAITLIHIITLGALFFFGMQAAWNLRWQWIATPLDKPIAVLVSLSVLSTLFSQHRPESLWALALLMNYILVFYLTIHTTCYRSHLLQLIYMIIGIAVFLSIFGLIKKFGTNPFPWWDYPDIVQNSETFASTYGNRNHLAGYLEMAIPLLLGLLMTGVKPGMVSFLIYLLTIILTAFTLALSRGGWGSSALSLVFMSAMLLRNRYYPHKNYLLIFIAGVFFLSLVVFSNTAVVERILTMTGDGLGYHLGGRIQTWKGCLKMISDYPILGTGPGTFSLAFTRYEPPCFATRSVFAHNDYLQTLSEVGLPLLPVMIWIIIGLFKKGLNKLNNPSRLVRGTTIGALSGITAILFHSVVDFNLHIPANALLFTVLAGIVAGPIPKRKENHAYANESSFQ